MQCLRGKRGCCTMVNLKIDPPRTTDVQIGTVRIQVSYRLRARFGRRAERGDGPVLGDVHGIGPDPHNVERGVQSLRCSESLSGRKKPLSATAADAWG
jgi:hypothetical protein